MVVLILSAAPASLRGAMTRWLLEVSPLTRDSLVGSGF